MIGILRIHASPIEEDATFVARHCYFRNHSVYRFGAGICAPASSSQTVRTAGLSINHRNNS
jgi:regulation of enolase protein 1 (concanavalin A-like superfamily)